MSLAKQAVKLWSESVDEQRKMDGPSETELIELVKATSRLRYGPPDLAAPARASGNLESCVWLCDNGR
jgi:hypothetical protein